MFAFLLNVSKGLNNLNSFMEENLLLSNDVAVNLYHQYAKHLPIIDYHCHLSPKEIYKDKRFANITEAWLYGDHYKIIY